MDPIKTTRETAGWRVGDVVVTFKGAFSSGVILGFESYNGKDWDARIARPMVHAHDIGTTQAAPLLSFESYTCPVGRLAWAEESDRERRYYKEGEARMLIARPEVIKGR